MKQLIVSSYILNIDSFIIFMEQNGFKVLYEYESDCLEIKDLDSDKKTHLDIVEIFSNEIDLDLNKLRSQIPVLYLDSKEITNSTIDLLEKINTGLLKKGLKLVDLETNAEYVSLFITKKEETTLKGLYESAVALQSVKEKLSYEDLLIFKDYTEGEIDLEEVKAIIYQKLKNDNVNYDLLLELLEEIDPDMNYDIVEKKNKSFLTRKKH